MALSWALMPQGPGGNIIGINFANDGAAVCRTDTGGSYVNTLANPIWRLLQTVSSMPAGYATIMGDYFTGGVSLSGGYACAIAPSNSQIIYMLTSNGDLFRSSNQGVTFSTTGFANISIAVNAAYDSSFNNKIAVDPHNAAVVMVGWPGGVAYSTNSGTSFAATSISTGTYASLIAFDPSSWTSGNTPGIYATRYGTGVYHTTGGVSGSWTLLNSAGMPVNPARLAVSGDGTVYAIDDDGVYTLKKYSGGAWSTLSPLNVPAFSGGLIVRDVMVDPANNSRVVVGLENGLLSESSDHGATWSSVTPGPPIRATPADVPWIATTKHDNFAGGNGAFNPALTNTLYMVDGINVWTTVPFSLTCTTTSCSPASTTGNVSFLVTSNQTIPLTMTAGANVHLWETSNTSNTMYGNVVSYTPATATTGTLVVNIGGGSGSGTHSDWTIRIGPRWTSLGAGINQLNNTRVVVPPGGYPFVTSWDRCGLLLKSTTVFPANQPYVATASEIIAGWDADYSATNPSYLAAIYNFAGVDVSGYSSDKGDTWFSFGSHTPYTTAGGQPAGYMAVAANATTSAATQNIVWFPGSFGGGNRPFYSTDGGANWALCSFPAEVPTTGTTGWGGYNIRGLRQVAADRVALNTFYAYNSVTRNVYKSTNGGATWGSVKVNTTTPINSIGINAIKAVDTLGSTNTSGWLFAWGLGNSISDGFIRSKDGGVTWPSVTPSGPFVAAMGIGASVNGAVPAILVCGILGGVRGLYLSIDDCVTWANVTGNYDNADEIIDIEGDKTTPNVWYVMTFTTGVFRGAEAGSGAGPTGPAIAFSNIQDSGRRQVKMIGY